ncbi:MAG: DUF1343 domain-containing protein [Bacteroidales bacterium]|nr:DUF1343 domain-containing protein [Bacteroidales bacterium]
MFSFRTTPIADQPDRGLNEGRVGCLCTANCWNPDTEEYLYDIFRKRGNLAVVFAPQDAELSPQTSHIDFSQEDLAGLDAVVVEIQDVGTRYFNYTRDVMRLLLFRSRMEKGPSIYVVDHDNAAGRAVEGGIPYLETSPWIPKVALRHGLTLGELCYLYYDEMGATFPLHIISARAVGSGVMPWTIAPAADIPGFFTPLLYSGGGLWNNTTITPGTGTSRPYEYVGAPFIKGEDSLSNLPQSEAVMLRPCTFTPSAGRYAGEKCCGCQIMLRPGLPYHSLLHTLRLMRYFSERFSQFEMEEGLFTKLADPVIEEYLRGNITFDIVEEHVKVEEQKWIRKAKRYLLYGDAPVGIK